MFYLTKYQIPFDNGLHLFAATSLQLAFFLFLWDVSFYICLFVCLSICLQQLAFDLLSDKNVSFYICLCFCWFVEFAFLFDNGNNLVTTSFLSEQNVSFHICLFVI